MSTLQDIMAFKSLWGSLVNRSVVSYRDPSPLTQHWDFTRATYQSFNTHTHTRIHKHTHAQSIMYCMLYVLCSKYNTCCYRKSVINDRVGSQSDFFFYNTHFYPMKLKVIINTAKRSCSEEPLMKPIDCYTALTLKITYINI